MENTINKKTQTFMYIYVFLMELNNMECKLLSSQLLSFKISSIRIRKMKCKGSIVYKQRLKFDIFERISIVVMFSFPLYAEMLKY